MSSLISLQTPVSSGGHPKQGLVSVLQSFSAKVLIVFINTATGVLTARALHTGRPWRTRGHTALAPSDGQRSKSGIA